MRCDKIKFAALPVAALTVLASCAARSFRVIPATPAYLLRAPDRVKTPFPDVLRRFNGFEAGHDAVDLRPLMALRIENAYYQPGASRRGLAGFLGTELARYEIRADGLKLLSVNSMPNRPAGDAPVQDLIRASEMHYRCYRFFYEILFRKTGETRGSVLLGAESENELNELSAALLKDPDAACSGESSSCTVFPEACSVSIEMQIVVNGGTQSVVWGTLLSALASGHLSSVHLSRLYEGRAVPVKLDSRDPDALQLPLLPGDRISWAGH